MGEGLLGGVLGEEEKTELEGPDPLIATEAFAAAVAARLSGNDPGVARETEEFLRHQSRLLKIQAEHLVDEHALRVELLKNQRSEDSIRGFGMRLRVAFQIFVVLIATVIGVGALVMLRDAFTSRRVVIEPFRAPPSMATRGVDGSIIASGLLDELSRLQYATRSSSAAYSLTSAWADNIKLDVAETGITFGELSRLLRERFGHDVHIDGELIEALNGGLALTVRGNGVPAKTFSGGASELEKLTTASAEYVYSKSQPARWAAYLSEVGRNAEVIEFCRTTLAGADATTRAELLNTWANAIETTGGSTREALVLLQEAVATAPRLSRSYANLMNTHMVLGEEQEAWRAGQAYLKMAGGRPSSVSDQTSLTNWDQLTWNLQEWRDALIADAAATSGMGSGFSAAGPTLADIQMRLHEPAAAELSLKTTLEDRNDPNVAALASFVRGRLAAEAGDKATALAHMEAFGEAFADPNESSNSPGYNCWIAPVEEAAGHPGKADALLNSAGTFVDCYRFRADILDGRGDWAGAQKAYAAAVALAPDLPAAYYSWGLALARHDDLQSATEKLKQASERGPHWADPLKAWGDVLLRQGQSKEAMKKYNEALKFAPNWAALKEAASGAQHTS